MIAGALFGLLFGGYIANLGSRKATDFNNMVHPVIAEQTRDRCFTATIAGLIFVFSAIGPYIAFGKFSRWVDDAIYGFLKALFALAIVTWFLQILFGPTYKTSYHHWGYIASHYWLPLLFILGPVIGILHGKVERLESMIKNHDFSGQNNSNGRSDQNLYFIETVVKGIFGGILLGLFSGYYYAILSLDFVFEDKALNKIPEVVQLVQPNYISALTLKFTLVMGYLGAFLAFGMYDRWIKHAFYGLTGCIILITIVRLATAYLLYEQPFSSYPFRFELTEKFLLPVTILLGPLIGILIGKYFRIKPDFPGNMKSLEPGSPERGQTT